MYTSDITLAFCEAQIEFNRSAWNGSWHQLIQDIRDT